jgi:formylglycine-generating enzyme required for sulfatase activity
MRALLALTLLLPLAPPASAVTIEWTPVGDPGNAPDAAENCFASDCGAVPYPFEISRYEITNAQYVEFLNAKAASDPHGLYSPSMGNDPAGGIARSGDPGSYSYAAKAGFADKPVNFVTFYDALRFVNWLDNGQGGSDTETGSYTITAEGIDANTITRNPDAEVVMPSENEWVKAAYFDGATWFDYPAGTDVAIVCAAPTAAANRANCEEQAGGATDVGSYPGSPSPYGTFDQGGNLFEWNEQIVNDEFTRLRGLRGAGWGSDETALAASNPELLVPTSEFGVRVGFRVARVVPEPGAAGACAIAALAALARQRRAADVR